MGSKVSKTAGLSGLFLAGWAFCALSCRSPVLPSFFKVEFPRLPAHWEENLGKPEWKVEWMTSKGNERAFSSGTSEFFISLPPEWPNPVLAWPCWEGLEPGLFQPAGGIYPFEVEGGTIKLSWRGGADAVFYKALDEQAGVDSPSLRRGRYFDWRRFRDNMAGQNELWRDPWLVNWKEAAAKVIASGFRTSYIKAEVREPLNIAIPHGGVWIHTSPFRGAESWMSGDSVDMALGSQADIWLCVSEGTKVGLMALSKNTPPLWALFRN